MICPRCAKEIPDDAVLCCYCGRTIVRKQSKVHQRPNGSGTVFQRKGQKTWTAQYTVPTGWYIDDDGKRHRKYKTKGGFEKKTDALAFIESLKKDNERKPAPPLSEYWKQYSSGALQKLGPDKITAYNIAWKRMKSLAHRRIDTISVKEMQECVDKETSTFYPAKDMRQLFKSLFKIAAAEKYVDKDLPTFISLPELIEGEQTPFTVEEQKALWKSYESGNRDAAIPLCMIYTGMMTGEMEKLEGSMIHWDENQIVGVSIKTKVRKKSPVYFPDDIKPVLLDLTEGKSGRIFTKHKEEIYKRYYAALETAGVRKLVPYSCRHTIATRLAIDETIAPQTIKLVMRWSTTKMLDRYAHPGSKDALSAIQTLNRKEEETPAESAPVASSAPALPVASSAPALPVASSAPVASAPGEVTANPLQV